MFIPETPKWVFYKQWRPSWNATFHHCLLKKNKIFRQKKYNNFYNYNLTTLDMCNGLSKGIVSNQKEDKCG